MAAIQHRVESLVFNSQTQPCILLSSHGDDYIFRYGYDDYAKAEEAVTKLDDLINRPKCDIATYIAFNFWIYDTWRFDYYFSRATSRTINWNISRTDKVRR